MPEHPVLAICGPTAAGKSAVAVDVAARLAGGGTTVEIVCCDSMQVYRGMDVGTAKPGPAERRRLRHHCLDLVAVWDTFSAADYQRHARRAIDDVLARGHVPLVVGGTGLYLRAAVDDVTFGGVVDTARRARLEARPLAELVAELRRTDPARAERTDLANPRRVVRAVELARDLGPGVDPDVAWAERRGRYPLSLAVVAPATRAELYARMDARIDAMIGAGWLAEAADLGSGARRMSRTAAAAIGYAELLGVAEGVLSLEEAVATIRRRTRAYARRQLTWFRAEPRAAWHTGPPAAVVAPVVRQFERALSACTGTSSRHTAPPTTS